MPMTRALPTGSGFTDGAPRTIGRDGHILIDDPSLSRGHAEIRFVDGKIRLRDLGSTNGTYLIIDNSLVAIRECYVSPDQPVVLGSRRYTVKALLASIGIYASYSDDVGLVIKSSNPADKTVTIETDLDELVSHTISRLYE